MFTPPAAFPPPPSSLDAHSTRQHQTGLPTHGYLFAPSQWRARRDTGRPEHRGGHRPGLLVLLLLLFLLLLSSHQIADPSPRSQDKLQSLWAETIPQRKNKQTKRDTRILHRWYILPCPVSCYPFLSYLMLASAILSCAILSIPLFFHTLSSYPLISCPILFNAILLPSRV